MDVSNVYIMQDNQMIVYVLQDIQKLMLEKLNVLVYKNIFFIINFIIVFIIKNYIYIAPIPSTCSKYVRIESAGTNYS